LLLLYKLLAPEDYYPLPSPRAIAVADKESRIFNNTLKLRKLIVVPTSAQVGLRVGIAPANASIAAIAMPRIVATATLKRYRMHYNPNC